METTELHLIFKGKVQGVGFRWTVVDIAQKNQLTGWVKNLVDGDVEVLIQGNKPVLEKFLEDLKAVKGSARVDRIISNYRNPKTICKRFDILR